MRRPPLSSSAQRCLSLRHGISHVSIAYLPSGSLTHISSDDGIPLVIWGIAEAAVTIMAASVPMLRILVKTVKATNRHNQRRPRIIDPDNDRVKLVRPSPSQDKKRREEMAGSVNLYRLEQSLVSRP